MVGVGVESQVRRILWPGAQHISTTASRSQANARAVTAASAWSVSGSDIWCPELGSDEKLTTWLPGPGMRDRRLREVASPYSVPEGQPEGNASFPAAAIEPKPSAPASRPSPKRAQGPRHIRECGRLSPNQGRSEDRHKAPDSPNSMILRRVS